MKVYKILYMVIGFSGLLAMNAKANSKAVELKFDFREISNWTTSFNNSGCQNYNGTGIKVESIDGIGLITTDFSHPAVNQNWYGCIGCPRGCLANPSITQKPLDSNELLYICEIRYKQLTYNHRLSVVWDTTGNPSWGNYGLPYGRDWITQTFPVILSGGRINNLHIHMSSYGDPAVETAEIEYLLLRIPRVYDYKSELTAAEKTIKGLKLALLNANNNEILQAKETLNTLQQAFTQFHDMLSVEVPTWTASEIETHLQKLLTVMMKADEFRGKLSNQQLTKKQPVAYRMDTSLRKVFPTEPIGGIEPDKYIVNMAKNEWESFQLLILAGKEEFHVTKVEATFPENRKTGRVMSNARIEIYRVGFVNIEKPTPGNFRTGLWPDPLLPVDSFVVKEHSIQPVWISVYVPANVDAGEYRGWITVYGEKNTSDKIQYNIKVRKFTLSEKRHLKTPLAACTMFDDRVSKFNSWYPESEHPRDEIFGKLYQLMTDYLVDASRVPLRHVKINGYENNELKLDFSEADKWTQYCLDKNMGYMSFYYSSEFDKYGSHGQDYAKAYTEHIREKKWEDDTFVYIRDEPVPTEYEIVRKRCDAIKTIAPELPRMITAIIDVNSLVGCVDIWCPSISDGPTFEQVQRCRKRGEKVWFYVSVSPKKPWPNFFIDYPATDHRVLFWMAYKYGAEGFLYYAMDAWDFMGNSNYDADPSRRFPNKFNTLTCLDGNGDGLLIYPGTDGPWASQRLSIIRDGIEDYEYMALLEELIEKLPQDDKLVMKAKEILKINDEVVKNLEVYTNEVSVILNERKKIGDIIEEINRRINK